MNYILKTPQIGEVGHQVTIVKFHKQVGDFIRKDEPIVTLETSKAALDIESSVTGIVEAIFFAEGMTVATGSHLLAIRSDGKEPDGEDIVNVISDKLEPQSSTQKYHYQAIDLQGGSLRDWLGKLRNQTLSPREKAYCRSRNVVPIHLHKNFKDYTTGSGLSLQGSNEFYEDIGLSKQQALMLATLAESQKHIVQANIQCICDNACIDQYRQNLRQDPSSSDVPSRLEIIAWSTIIALERHPNFRSRLIGPEKLRRFKNPNLGIAVALQNDELTTAIIPNIFSYDFKRFVRQCRTSIVEARNDNHIVTYHPLVISDLSVQGIVNAVPVVVFPACATLFIGCPPEFDRSSFYLSLSFDHRFINGTGAAAFLKDIRRNLKGLTLQSTFGADSDLDPK